VGFWAFLLVLVVAYSLPWVQDKVGNQLAIYTSASGGGQYEYCNPLTPAISIADLRNDTTGPQQIRDVFQPLSTEYGRWWADTRVRFVFVSTEGMRYDQRTRGFGGVWSSEHANTYFTDVTHEPIGDGPWDYPLDVVDTDAYSNFRTNERSWFGLRIDEKRLNGGQSYRKSINVFQFLVSVISVLLIVHLMFRLFWAFLKKWDHTPKRHRLIHRAAISVAFIVLLVFGYRLKSEYHHIAGVDITKVDPSQIGDWIDSEQFEQFLVDPDQTESLIACLRELSADLPDDLILAYQTMRDTDANSITEYTILNAQLRYNAELMSFSRLRFLESGPNATTTPGTLPGYLEHGFTFDHAADWGALWIGYNSASDSRHVSIYWTRLIFAGFVAWMALRIALWIAHRFAFRSQRQRAGRDQCIYCAYPLNEHALQLRRDANPESQPPSPPKMIDPDLI
tara:strand:+ start:30323 stop:31675 length:1353 start_codon:yes stop_codon:yes gene_type:complete